MNFFRRTSSTGSSLEVIIYATAGTGMFIGLFVVLPFTLVRDLYDVRPLLAGAVAAVCLLTVAGLGRDLATRRFSPVSKAVLGLWFLCVLFVSIAS